MTDPFPIRSEIDSATALLPLRGDVAEEAATPDACGLRITRVGDGWQVERPAATATWIDGGGLLGGAKSAAGHYAPQPYGRKDGGPPR